MCNKHEKNIQARLIGTTGSSLTMCACLYNLNLNGSDVGVPPVDGIAATLLADDIKNAIWNVCPQIFTFRSHYFRGSDLGAGLHSDAPVHPVVDCDFRARLLSAEVPPVDLGDKNQVQFHLVTNFYLLCVNFVCL